MQWRELRSRAIRLIGHDFDTHRLIVRFDGGMFYAYEGVSDDVLATFAEAQVPGQLIRDYLRPRSYSDKTRGHSSLEGALVQASTLGLHSISRSPRQLESRSFDGLDAAGVTALSNHLDIDEDCVGNHTCFILGETAGRARLLWHLNEATGLVVPPQPRVLRTNPGTRSPRVRSARKPASPH